MIMRFYLIAGVLLLGSTAYFTVVRQEPGYQGVSAMSSVTELQNKGILPTGPFAENEEIEHGVFEVPPMDEVMLEQAVSDMDMGSMDMSGMDMTPADGGTMTMPDGSTMPAADMAPADGDTMTMPDGATMPAADMAPADSDTMTMPDGSTMPMADMAPADGDTMAMPDGSTMPAADMAPADGDTMAMPDGSTMPASDMAPADGDTMTMPDDTTMPMANMAMATDCSGDNGLGFCADDAAADREIELSMSEWTFSDLSVEVQKGERIRFTVRNDGKNLHEFMFMAMAQMQAVNYRAQRADWNLLEHEALFEQSLMLPGESISFVVEVQSTGSWMFMCMVPYHMQMGMMGQIATPGAAMDM
ncbi:multicopper oxidase domain-containing protein [Maritalea sp.]|uniref:multicopper oxidase domain-containing protein n=1 Tax=Maritalea sp. TaxID=2003361 RepID=UPI0039E31726